MAEGAVKLFEFTAKDNVSGTVKAINKNLDSLRNSLIAEANAVGMSAKEYDLYQASLAGATRDQKIHIAQIHDELSARRATIAMTKAHSEALHMNATTMRAAGKSAGFMNGQLRFMRGGMGQVGHQVQDIAVQLQMGQNAMLVFGQQGSQIASLFGPHGALLGAFLAISAALVTAFAPALFKSNKAMLDMADNADELIDIFPQLTAAQAAYVALDVRAKIVENNKAMADTVGIISDLKDEQIGFGSIYDLFMNPEKWVVDTAKRNAAMAGQVAVTDTLTAANEELNEALSGQSKEVRDMVVALEKQAFEAGKSERHIALLSVAEGENASATRMRINAAYNTIDAEAARQQALKDSKKALEDANKEEERRIKALRDAAHAGIKSGDDFMASLEKQAATYGAARDEALEYSVSVANLSPLQRQEAAVFIQTIRDKMAAIEEFNSKKAESEKTQNQFGSLQNNLAKELDSPEQQLQTQLETRQKIIDDMAALGLENQATIDAARIDAETAFNQAMDKLAQDRVAGQMQAASSVISSFQSQISAMAAMVDEGSTLGKAFYVAQQGMAAAMAIIKGYEAASSITAAMAMLGPAGIAAAPAMATAAISMGYVNAAMIAGQTLASFDGGGYTGDGPRSGGMDGKGGRLAVVHPRETILDHTKGQGNGGQSTVININNNVDAAGSGPEVDIKIQAAMERTNATTIATIQDLMRRRRFA